MKKLQTQPKMKNLWIRAAVILAVFMLFLLTSFLPVWAVPNGEYSHSEIIIQPEELKTLITDKRDPNIRIVDMRDNVQYLTGHIPGAVQIWRPDIEDKKHSLPGMMAPQAQIEEILGSWGVRDKDTLVIYTSADGPDNGRLWWILAYYGFPITQMKLLDGGIEAWKGKGFPTEMISPRIEKTVFKFRVGERSRGPLLCTLTEVKSALKAHDQIVLDVRSKREFLGEIMGKGAIRAGRIPGVAWIEWKEVLVEEGPFKGYWRLAKEIRKIFSARGITPGKDIYIY
jgi:thiosulfate/3-mercaptopyruvate sulfurtransferase